MWHCKRKRTRTRFKHDMPLYVMVRWNYFTSKIASTAEACKCRCMYFFFWSSHLLCSRRFYFILHVFIVSCMCELDSARWDNRLMCVWWRMCDVNFGVIFVVTHHKFKVSSCVGVWNRLLAFFFHVCGWWWEIDEKLTATRVVLWNTRKPHTHTH